MKRIVGVYIRLPMDEIARLRDHPEVLPKYDPRVALGDGRGLDLGRAWEDLGVFIDGGVKMPDTGPSLGKQPLPSTDERAAWSYVEPEQVAAWAAQLGALRRSDFHRQYDVDNEDTQDSLPSARTGGWGDREGYLYKELRALGEHYAAAAECGEGMLVRIGERV